MSAPVLTSPPTPPLRHAPTVEWLLQTPHVQVRLHRHPRPATTVVVTFDPINWKTDGPPYGVDFLLRCGVDVVSVRKTAEHFYQPLTHEEFDAAVRPHVADYQRRIAYGTSLGAYAVLYFCRHGYDHVIASSPRVSAHPRHGTDFWQQRVTFLHQAFDPEQPASSPATVFYDPHDAQDRRFVEEEVHAGWPRATLLKVPYAGHPANQFLAEVGFIAPFVRAILAGQAVPVLARRTLKARSATYLETLAQGCLAHRHLRWAEALTQRAMQVNPRLPLAPRTLGMTLQAQGRFTEAAQWMRRYLTDFPLDGAALRAMQSLPAAEAVARIIDTPPLAIDSHLPSLDAPHAVAPASLAAGDAAAPGTRPALPWKHRLAQALLLPLQHAGLTVSRADVTWCYRHLLGREPESEAAIRAHRRFFRFRSLVECIVQSPEFQGASGHDRGPAGGALASATISPEAFRHSISRHHERHPPSSGEQAYVDMHFQRLLDTLNIVQHLLPQGGRMLDYSAMKFFTHAAGELVPGLEQTNVSGVNFELDDYIDRYGAASFDLCLNTEVLEHLLFDPSRMVFSINRLLRPQGMLVLSTPNAVSLGNGLRLLGGQPPSLWNQLNAGSKRYYDRHNRDWTPFEVQKLLQEHGFEVVELTTRDYYESTRTLLTRHAEKARALQQQSSHGHFGDTLLVVARKVREVQAPVRSEWLYVNSTKAGTP